MRRNCVFIVAVALASMMIWQAGRACTTFCLNRDNRPVFGRNFDYGIGYGLVIVNKRNVAKEAANFGRPARWVSTYGSVTFNLYGRELPMGGMNEAGLVVENMWLDATEYAPPDSLPTIDNLQWIQYQLDNCASVAEVIEHASKVRIINHGGSAIHYLICDAKGECAIIECLKGKLTVYADTTLPVGALTNSTYESSLDYLKRYNRNETSDESANEGGSLRRFVRATQAVEAYNKNPGTDAVAYAFEVLDTVSSPEWTQWSIVYDVAGRRIHFRTKGNPKMRIIDLARFDFSCRKPVLIHDLETAGSGDITGMFENYSVEKNRALIMRAFGETDFLKGTPQNILELLAIYPESLMCRDKE